MNSPSNEQPLSLLRRLLRLGADRPLSVLLLIVALSALALIGTLRVELDTGMARLTGADGIERQTYLHIAREFGSDRCNVIYLRDEQLWTPERLLAVRRLHDGLRQLPFVERVDSIYSSPTVVVAEDRRLAQPLLPAVPADAASAEAARQRALADPFALRHLVSADGKALAIVVALREEARGDIYAAIEAVLAPQRAQFAESFQVGPARLQQALQTALRHDLVLVVPLFLLILWGTLWLFTRSAFSATLPLLVGALSLLWTAGIMGYAGLPLGVMMILLPLLASLAGTLQILRMASGAYADVTGDAANQRQPDRRRVTEFMVRNLGLPLILTVLTLALGFASTLFLQNTQALHDFGMAALLAMLLSGVLAMLLVPALVVTMAPTRVKPASSPMFAHLPELLTGTLGLLRRRSVFWSLATLMLAGATVIQREAPPLVLANDAWSNFKAEDLLLRDAARLHADLSGSQVFYVMLDSNVEGGFRDPSNLRRLADIQAFITKQQVFDRSHSLADLAMQANHTATPAGSAPQVPTTRQLLMQALMPHSPHDLEPYVSHDWRRANIVVRHNLRDSSQINRHVGELRQAVANYAGPGMVTAVVGENLLINAAADQFPRLQLTATLVLLGVVFIVMTLMYTSIKGGLAALTPGLVPIAMMLGGMQLLQIPLSPATLVVSIVTIGIALESSVNLFSRYSALARKMTDSEAAVLETVRREALPMLAIHLTLAASCLAWLASDLALAAQFGALTATTLLLSALTNLILMPLLMSHIRLVGLYEILAMTMQREALEASPLFQEMSDFQIRKTILISDLVDVAVGQSLITQGSIDRSMYVVVNGQFEVVRREGGSVKWRTVVGPGDVIGEIGFVRETRRIADVRALEPASALRFDYARLKKDLAYFPYLMNRLNFNISGILGKRLSEVVEAQSSLEIHDQDGNSQSDQTNSESKT